jgi:predicted DNA-binding mobile mystery protein A
MKKKDSIAHIQFERRVQGLRENLQAFQIRNGWIHYLRSTFGMKLSTLARLAGTTSSSVQQAEKREAQGKVTLETLRRMAEAMDCEFVYAFIPRNKIEVLLQERAHAKAQKILLRADTHMSLEDQKVKHSFNERVERLANKLLETSDVW